LINQETIESSVDVTPAQPVSLSQRILSQEEQVSRFDRWVEFFSAVVLALATVATAWCAYQSTLWGGDELKFRAAANSATIKASQFSGAALQQTSFQAGLFVQWAAAVSEQNDLLTDFLYQRFPPLIDLAMLVLSVLVLLVGIVIALTFPIQLG
jgi:hypothetical protein